MPTPRCHPQYHAWLIAPGIARFCPLSTDPASLPPFPGYVTQPPTTGEAPRAFLIRPRYSTASGRAAVDFFNTRPASLYATGEHAGPLLRNGTTKTLWNSDSYEYSESSPSLYQSHPFILGVRPGHADAAASKLAARVPLAFGIIIETTYACTINFRGRDFGIGAQIDGPPPAVTVILRDTPQQVLESLAQMTGTIPMPPLWALGYHQCRYSYTPDSQVREVAEGFRSRNIPCDSIWLDIDYMDGYRCFTFDKGTFPDPGGLVTDLHKDGFKVVAMIDPGLRVDEAYTPYTQGCEQGHFVKDKDGNDYRGPVWPGPCAFPDFTRRRTRDWWATLYQPLLELGIDGFWNDMNEPAVFVPSKTMPTDNRHDADQDLGGPDSHARYHNIYGMQMVRATRTALETARLDKRPFLLTRAGFLGYQRFAATWSGDNVATWDHLRWSIPMALNMGLSGQPFSGPDIGGFIGETDPNLFARWMGIGTLLPFCRSHKNKGTKMHEPWMLGKDCEKACRLAIERRYRLLPHLYTLFHEAATRGLPVMRPVCFADLDDQRLRAVDSAFLLGENLLVKANVTQGDVGPSPFPKGRWLPFELTDAHAALPQLFLRAGSLIPVGKVLQHTEERNLDTDPITLIAALDDSGQASGTLYEDDGDGYGYKNAEYRLATFRVNQGKVEVIASEGKWGQPSRKLEPLILGSTA